MPVDDQTDHPQNTDTDETNRPEPRPDEDAEKGNVWRINDEDGSEQEDIELHPEVDRRGAEGDAFQINDDSQNDDD